MKITAPWKEQLSRFAKSSGLDSTMAVDLPYTSAFTKDITDVMQKRTKAGLDITKESADIAKPVVAGESEDDLLGTKTKNYAVYDPQQNKYVPLPPGSMNLTGNGNSITGATVQNTDASGKPTGPAQPIDVGGKPAEADLPPTPIDATVKSELPPNPLGVKPTENPTIKKMIARGIIDENTFDFRAMRLLGGDKTQVQGAGMGKVGAMIRNALQTRAAEMAIQMNIDPGEANARIAGFTANTQALKTLVNQKNAIESFSNNEVKNLDVLVKLADKVDATGRPVIERWVRAGRQAIQGDPDVAEFNFQMQLVRNGVAKIVSNPNMTGVLTKDQVDELRDGLPNASSAKQIKAIAARAKADFANRHEAIDEQIAKVNKAFGTLAKSNAPAGKTQDRVVPWTEFFK